MAKKRKNSPGNSAGGNSKKGKAKEAIKKASQIGRNIALFVPLLPMRIIMAKILKSKGFKPHKDIKDLVFQFYENIVKPGVKKNFEDFENVDDTISFEEFYSDENVIDDAISGVIKGILEFFKSLKKKKDSLPKGEKLPPAEEKMLEIAEDAKNIAKDTAVEGAQLELGKIAPIMIIGLILYMVFK